MKNTKKAFTLVELLVTISIISIISLIGFISYTSFSINARDSSRMLELDNISLSLYSYSIKNGFYPKPTDGIDVTFSGSKLWTQGIFGESVIYMLNYGPSKVLDPLVNAEYTYSVKNSGKEFSLAGILETSKDFESSIDVGAIVVGNYNGEIVSTRIGALNYVLALPSIIASDLSSADIVDISTNNRLVYNGYSNLPASYSGTKIETNLGIDLSANTLLVYSGSLSSLHEGYNQVIFLQNLQKSYSGILLGNKISVNKLDSAEINSLNPSSRVKLLACDTINKKLKYFVECDGVDFLTFYIVNVLNIDINKINGEEIEVVFQDNNGDYWFGTDDGISFFDGVSWVYYNEDNSDLKDNEIESIAQDLSGNLWFGTDEKGVDKFDPIGNTWVNYSSDVLISTHIQSIYTSADGTVWIGTKEGVSFYNGDVWNEYTKQETGLTTNNIKFIYSDSYANVWFGTKNKGLDKYIEVNGVPQITNYQPNNTSNKLPNKKVRYLFEDKDGFLWVGTDGGLGKLNISSGVWNNPFTNSSTSGGLPDNKIKYIFGDETNVMWFGTDNGLARYDGASWSNFFPGKEIFSIFKNTSGNFLIIYEDGLYIIDSNGNVI